MAQIPCPQCDRLARILDRFTLTATGGPVEHLKLSCPGGHVLTPLVEALWPTRTIAKPNEHAEQTHEPRFARQE